MNRRRLLGTAAGVSLGSSLAGCLGTADLVGGNDDRDDVRIGVLGGSSSEASVIAAEVAAMHINEAGGIDGRDVTVVGYPTNSSPAEARRNYHRLMLEDDVDVTVGISNEGVLNYLIEDIAEQETLHFTTGIGSGIVDRLLREEYEKYKYHFRTGPLSGENFMQSQLAFIGEMFPRQGWGSVALLMEGYQWTEGLIDLFHRQLEDLGFEIAYRRRYRPSIDDFSSIYDDIEESGADVTWVGMGQTGSRAVVQWARQRRAFEFGGIHVGLQTPSYYDALEGAPRYTFASTAATATSELTPRTQEFVDGYREIITERGALDTERPIYTAYNTYDSVLAYKEAVEEAGTFDTEAVIEALEDLEIDGTTGEVSYYEQGTQYPHDRVYDPTADTHSGPVFFQWQANDAGEGVQEVIWPGDVATAEYTNPPWL